MRIVIDFQERLNGLLEVLGKDLCELSRWPPLVLHHCPPRDFSSTQQRVGNSKWGLLLFDLRAGLGLEI